MTPLFMTQKDINDHERATSTTMHSVLRVLDKKQQQSAVKSVSMPTSWARFDTADGPDDSTVSAALDTIDAKYDWLAVIQATIAGTLTILVDSDLNLEGRQVCMRYQCITRDMLLMRFSPFSKCMNDYLRDHNSDIVYVPASVLVAQDRAIGQKLLDSMSESTAKEVRSKARTLVAAQMNISHSGHPYIAVPDIFLAALRLGYKANLDAPRKKILMQRFCTRPDSYMTIDELATRFRETENEYKSLSADGRSIHNEQYVDMHDTWMEWIRDRTWAEEWT